MLKTNFIEAFLKKLRNLQYKMNYKGNNVKNKK